MKRSIFTAVAVVALMASCSKDDSNTTPEEVGTSYTLTFEGESWNDLMQTNESDIEVKAWSDSDNTTLTGETKKVTYDEGETYWWDGGFAISNFYMSTDSEVTATNQLSVPCKDIITQGSGNNGSSRFAICYDNGYDGTNIPALQFADEAEFTIDNAYFANTSYTIWVCENSNEYSAALESSDELYITATGYNSNGNKTGSVKIKLSDNGVAIEGWKQHSLKSLGKVHRVEFDVDSTVIDNGSSTLPNYFAIDDITVIR